MRLRRSLSAKILITAFLNLVLLIIVFLVFARVQYRFDLSSFLLAPARDSIFSVSRLIALNLEETARPSWGRVLQQYASKYEAQVFLFDGRGKQYDGTTVTLPAAVATRMSQDLFFGNAPKPSDPRRAQRSLGEGPLFLVPAGNPTSYWVGAHIPIWPVRSGPPVPAVLIWRFHSLWTNTFSSITGHAR